MLFWEHNSITNEFCIFFVPTFYYLDTHGLFMWKNGNKFNVYLRLEAL